MGCSPFQHLLVLKASPEVNSRPETQDRVPGETYLGEHLLLSELSDRLDCLGGSLLELDALESLVHVESVVAASWLEIGFLSHLNSLSE